MSLEQVVAAPWKQSGGGALREQEFVVALSLKRDWFSPDQAKVIISRAEEAGLLRRDAGELHPTFDPAEVTIPPGFTPDETILIKRSPFEELLDVLLANGENKRQVVGEINRLQHELDITADAAAALCATSKGIDVSAEAARAADSLISAHAGDASVD